MYGLSCLKFESAKFNVYIRLLRARRSDIAIKVFFFSM
jgi:hypothetical protein